MLRIHCSYHKCLTVYFRSVLGGLCNRLPRLRAGYKHYHSLLEEFYRELGRYRVASVNNHALDLGRLGDDCRISRFVRDPRDLVVSGYFYHLRGAERWCHVVDPTGADWRIVNGTPPAAMPAGTSFASWLPTLDKEEGLIAEIEFRRRHLESMTRWPVDDPRIAVFRYEDVLGREGAVFESLLEHLRLPAWSRWRGTRLARRYAAAASVTKSAHIRDPRAGQWKEHFTPRVTAFFHRHHGEILDRYGYA